MKTRKYEDWLNESYYGPFQKIVKKVHTTKNSYDKYDAQSKQEDLANELGRKGFDSNITFAKLLKHPDFDKIHKDSKDAIYKVAGTGRTPNAKFVKKFVDALSTLGDDHEGSRNEIEDKITNAGYMARDIKDGDFLYTTYENLGYAKRRELQKEFGNFVEIKKSLTDAEIKHINRFALPELENYVSRNFTDERIAKYIKSSLDDANPKGSDERRLADMSWTQPAMKKPLEYIKTLISKGDWVKWDKLKVKELEMLGSDNSAVASSSFSTTYNYRTEFSINGKTFKIPKMKGGSTHYSGGWD